MEQINGTFIYRNFIRIILFCSLCFNSSVFGDCPDNVQPIKQGQTANCEGFLFSPQAESEAYKAKELADLEKSENEVLEQRLKLYMDATSTLSKDMAQRDNNESLIRIGYFVLGAVVVGFSVHNIK